jgi:hypothetical protein
VLLPFSALGDDDDDGKRIQAEGAAPSTAEGAKGMPRGDAKTDARASKVRIKEDGDSGDGFVDDPVAVIVVVVGTTAAAAATRCWTMWVSVGAPHSTADKTTANQGRLVLLPLLCPLPTCA